MLLSRATRYVSVLILSVYLTAPGFGISPTSAFIGTDSVTARRFFDAFGTSITVTNSNDSGPGSLRQAIADVATGGTIEFDQMFFGVQRTITLMGSDLTIGRNMVINGPGANLLTISGGGTTRVFRTTAQITLNNITITGGNVGISNGGGISNIGNLTVRNCHITGNTGSFGGGISNQGAGQLTVINSSIINNTGIDRGGGIDSTGVLSVQNSTISSNITTDTSGQNGGGIWTREAAIVNSTITNNAAFGSNSAGGVFRDAGSVTVVSSIIAANTNNPTIPDTASLDGLGISSLGYNLVGNRGQVVFAGTGDQAGNGTTRINPMLADLQNNGGATPTHSLLPGSPALDAGISSGFTTDQRGTGFNRTIDLAFANPVGGDGSDIGAFEIQTAPVTYTISGRVLSPSGLALRSLGVILTDESGFAQRATTSAFGVYTFTGVNPGNYILSVRSKRFRFAPVMLNANQNFIDVVLIGLE